jgi:hypothetical protein
MALRDVCALGVVAILALSGCSKKEEPPPAALKAAAPAQQPEMPPSHPPPTGTPAPQAHQPPAMPAHAKREIVVPEEVKNTWKAVVLEVTDKATHTSQDVTVDVGQSVKVDGLDITVDAFLPAFTMSATELTSSSNQTTNPAAKVTVKENGKEIFSSFLFSMHPDVHPFEHEKYSMILKDFIKK